MANVFVDVHPSKAELTFSHDGNCFFIASNASAYCLRQMLRRVEADGSTRSWHNALYDRRGSRFGIGFHGIWAKTNPNMSYRPHVSLWNSEMSKSLSSNFESFVCQFNHYGIYWMSNLIFLCVLTIVIPRLPCLFKMAKAVSSTVVLVCSVTSVSVNSFNFAMWAFASKCFPIELVPCSGRWPRTWWQTIRMMPGLPVASLSQCK